MNGINLSRILLFQQALLEYGSGLCHQRELLHSTLEGREKGTEGNGIKLRRKSPNP